MNWSLIRASNPRNPVVPSSFDWSTIDGSRNAPAGVQQYPSLLKGYVTRPPWNVAGVDYPVGCPAGLSLIDPSISPPANCTYSNGVLTVNADNVTIDGYDFSARASGAGTAISCSHNNLTIQNNKIGGTSYPALATGPIDFRGNGLTVVKNIIDGGSVGGTENQSTLLFLFPASDSGNVVFQYNWCKNYCQQVIEIVKSATLDYRFNLLDDMTVETGGHLNCLQWSTGTASAPLVAFNTFRHATSPGGEFLQFYFNTSGTMNSPLCTNNTLIALSGANMSNLIHGSGLGTGVTTLTGSPVVSSNYFDVIGGLNAFYPGSFAGWAASGNIDMTTGSTIAPA